jgi:hypothetical protein
MNRSRAWKGPALVRRHVASPGGPEGGARGDDRPTLPYGEGQLRDLTSTVCAVGAPVTVDERHRDADGDVIVYALERRAGWFAEDGAVTARATSEVTASLQPCSMDAVDADGGPTEGGRPRRRLQRHVAVVTCLCLAL